MMDIGAIGDAAIVRISEGIDMASAPRLEHVIKTVELSEARRVLLSLEDCPYADSTCLGIVLRASRRIGLRLAVVVPPGTMVRRIFEITGIANEPYVFGSVEEALGGA